MAASKIIENFQRYVKWMEKCVDVDKDPCEEFFEFACGKFKEENYDATLGEFSPVSRENIFDRLIMNQEISSPALSKARQFHRSFKSNIKDLLQDEDLVEYCGGFPAFNENWNSDNFDWIKAAGILDAMGLIIILCSCLQFENGRREISVETEEPHSFQIIDAEEKMRVLNISEEKISEVINDFNVIKEQLENSGLNGCYDFSLYENRRMTYAELKQDQSFDYQKFYESAFGQPLNDDDVISLNCRIPHHFELYFGIFAGAAPRTVANFITFKAVTRVDLEFAKHSVLTRHFAPVLLSVAHNFYWNEEEKRKWDTIFGKLKMHFEQASKDLQLERSDYSFLNEDKQERVLNYLISNFASEDIEKIFEELQISDNFFQNIINLGNFSSSEPFQKCLSTANNDLNLYFDSQRFLNNLIHYQLHPILRHFSSVYVKNLTDIFNKMDAEYFKEHLQDFDSIMKLMVDQLEQLEEEDILYYLEEDDWVQSFVSTILALRIAFEDYKDWLNQHKIEAEQLDNILEPLNLNSLKAFFVSFIQRHCDQDHVYKQRALIAVLNCPAFAAEFSCTGNNKMKAKKYVEVKWT